MCQLLVSLHLFKNCETTASHWICGFISLHSDLILESESETLSDRAFRCLKSERPLLEKLTNCVLSSGVCHSVSVSEIISVREEEENGSRTRDDGSWKKIKEREGKDCGQSFTGTNIEWCGQQLCVQVNIWECRKNGNRFTRQSDHVWTCWVCLLLSMNQSDQ